MAGESFFGQDPTHEDQRGGIPADLIPYLEAADEVEETETGEGADPQVEESEREAALRALVEHSLLLGERVRQALFGAHGQAVGQEILVGNVPFRVIGVMAPKPAPFPEDDVNNQVIVPVGAAAVRLVGSMELSRINVVIRDMQHAAETEAAIVKTLTARHGRKDFNILNQAQAVQQLAQANRTLTLMLGLIAAISLLVGGIGVMNVMLMTVRERTGEIGIRIATGARQADILRQFLVEAMLLTGLGGTVGVSGNIAQHI